MEKDEKLFDFVIPTLSNENFGLNLNYERYDEKTARLEAFPNDYILAKLANLAYKDSITIPSDLKDWEVLTYASNKIITNGYRGVAFLNPKMCHVVIAHRGTDFKKPGPLIADATLAFTLFEHQQAQSAASFSYLIAEEVKGVNMRNDYAKPPFRLTITGHSLGAWLAQYTTFTVKYLTLNENNTKFVRDDNYLSNIHPHTVVFESPGCKQIFEKLVKKLVYKYTYRRYGNYNTLDMTVYLNEPNPINCVKGQVGTIYMLPIYSHSISNVIDYLAKDKVEKKVVLDLKSGVASVIQQFCKWIVGSKVQRKLSTVLAKDNRCSLNVLTESEVEFVNDLYRLDSNNATNIKSFRDKFDIPKFEINREYNLLKGQEEDFKKVIVIVKNLPPNEQIVFKMIQDDVDDQVRSHLFKNDAELYEAKLLNFNGYYFNDDRYGLLDFLSSDNKILHVRVDDDSSIEYDFEINIIRNVINYYQERKSEATFVLSKAKTAFIEWNKLCKYIYSSWNFLNSYGLLVVEYCFEDESQKEKVLEFLQNINIKVIILSTNRVSFKDLVNITEVNGFGSKLTFGDLTVESQRTFLNRQIFKLNNQRISLNDLVTNITNENENGNENLTNSFPIVSLLELILASEFSTIDLDCHYSNLLKSVLFYDLYDEINQKQLLHNLEKSKVFILPEDATEVDLSNVFPSLNDLVNIKTKEEYEEKCFDETGQTKYLITTKNGKIFLTSIFNENFYIHRSIIHKRSVNPDIFKNTDNIVDFYIFYGDKKIFKSYASLAPKQEQQRFKFTFSVDEDVEIAKLSATNVHVFEITKDGSIDWKRSYGSINCLHKFMQSKEVSIKESDIMNDDQIIIISGEPGIGKSSVIEYLYLTLQSKYWIFAIRLKNCSFDGISDELTYDEVAKFITKNCSYDAKSIQDILSFCLQYESKRPIFLMLDSFDEICQEKYKIKVINVINFLKLNTNAKILITTRPHLSKEIENGISVFSSYFKQLDYQSQIVTFLVEFWKSHLCLFQKSIDEVHLRSVAENMLISAKNTIGETVSAFIEIPMNMRLLAETVTPETYITSQFSDVLTLYNKYITQRCDVYFQRFSLDPRPTVKKWLIESILGKISALSINQLLDVDIQHISDEEMEEFYKVGLVYLDRSNLKDTFLHESVCDYFISDSIQQWLTSQMYILFVEYDVTKFLISELFLNEELKKVRLFLNFHLKTILITSNRIELCKSKLLQICKDNYSLLFNKENESIFHICIDENLMHMLKYFLLKLLDSTNAKKILTEPNIRLETPLYYAINKTSKDDNPDHVVNCLTVFLNFLNDLGSTTDVKEIFLATLFNYFITNEDLDKLKRAVKNFEGLETIMDEINKKIPLIKEYLNACKDNNLELLTEILAKLDEDELIKTYLLKSTNEFKETGIHLTSDVNIAKILIQPFNMNLRDHHGMTPLCRSIKEKRGEIAKMLIEKGASYVGDNFGLTPLIHAAKYNLKEIVKMILKPNKAKVVEDVNACNLFGLTPLMIAARHGNEEIVTYLLDKNADIRLRDLNGLTAFHHAVKGEYTRIIGILKKRGSDINTRDKHGTTPLYYSVKHKNFSVVQSLLSYGADVNIGNIHGQYPLQRLIRENMKSARNKEVDTYIRMFLSGHSESDPATTIILTEEENRYIQEVLNKK